MNAQVQEQDSIRERPTTSACARFFRPSLWLVLALIAVRLLTLQAWAGFSSVFVFGDSLSAISGGGTQYPPPPGTSVDNYWNGRFSNGRAWVEYLADLQGITLNTNNDFSWFGGGSGSIQKTLVSGNFYPPPDFAKALCIFWPACSDCFALTLLAGTNSWSPTLADFGSYETATVGLLYTQGMRTVLIPNAVDISVVPFFTHTLETLGIGTIAANGIPSLATIHTNVIQYNAALATAIGQMRAQYPDLTIYAPDFFTQFNFFLSHPEIYGITTTSIDALEDQGLTDKSFNGPGANYVFWDYLHPTTKVHQVHGYGCPASHVIADDQPAIVAGLYLPLGPGESDHRPYRHGGKHEQARPGNDLDSLRLHPRHEYNPDRIRFHEWFGKPLLLSIALSAVSMKPYTYDSLSGHLMGAHFRAFGVAEHSCRAENTNTRPARSVVRSHRWVVPPLPSPLDMKALCRAMFALAAAAMLGLVASAFAQVPEQILRSFGDASQSGSKPVGILAGADGILYGTTSGGGIYSSGTIFRVSIDGSHYAVLHAFGGDANDGVTPQAGLVQGRDGMLYGTTSLGGTNKAGTVFRLVTDGSGYTTLHTCGSSNGDGSSPTALIQGADGALYGVTQSGGTNYGGVVFRLGTDGLAYSVLYNFGIEIPPTYFNGDGLSPVALTQGADGVLYGVTQTGGTNGVGNVFRLGTNGSAFAVLHTFGDLANDGTTPVGLARGSNGSWLA